MAELWVAACPTKRSRSVGEPARPEKRMRFELAPPDGRAMGFLAMPLPPSSSFQAQFGGGGGGHQPGAAAAEEEPEDRDDEAAVEEGPRRKQARHAEMVLPPLPPTPDARPSGVMASSPPPEWDYARQNASLKELHLARVRRGVDQCVMRATPPARPPPQPPLAVAPAPIGPFSWHEPSQSRGPV